MTTAVLVVVVLPSIFFFGTAGTPAARGTAVTVRAADGELLASVPLATDRFAVGYRNSVYRSLAEARYVVHPDLRFEVVELAADQVAVLEEYYAVTSRPLATPPGDRRAYTAPPDPARPPMFEVLNIAATDLGERTLYVPGEEPVALWRLVEDDPTVILQIEETP